MSTFERVSWVDFEIHKIDHQKYLIVDGDVTSHEKNN
jgi:hypothetical protein